jgi:hypothetical protein
MMASLIRQIFDAVRQHKGLSPLIIETTQGEATIPFKLARQAEPVALTTHMHFTAEAQSYRHPEQGEWTVTSDMAGLRTPPRQHLTYDEMRGMMKAFQAAIDRGAGHGGTDDEIAARRQPFVPKNNIFRFV